LYRFLCIVQFSLTFAVLFWKDVSLEVHQLHVRARFLT
jgi:hypothetical protein